MTYDGGATATGFDWVITTWENQGVPEMARYTWIAFESDGADSGPFQTSISPDVAKLDPSRPGRRADVLAD
jgi:hypothetical protein